eukprot:TRINITY_DN74749_c0_g1_i1.p1 TRINITY_DN74749_c0_g1~~TRINITY_DN74749_c0_g1_i1.p1  ORF type:complete len:602 (+),score=55.17 TRINITY_DN74749_c0_g1_i1:33-1808(+)
MADRVNEGQDMAAGEDPARSVALAERGDEDKGLARTTSAFALPVAPPVSRTRIEQTAAMKRAATTSTLNAWNDPEESQAFLASKLAEWTFETPGLAQDPDAVHGDVRKWVSTRTQLDKHDWKAYLTWWVVVAAVVIPLIAQSMTSRLCLFASETETCTGLDFMDLFSILVFCVQITRNELFVWAVYRLGIFLAKASPHTTKKYINKMTYNIGGVHTGCSFFVVIMAAGNVVFGAVAISKGKESSIETSFLAVAVALDALLLVSLLVLTIAAMPRVRHRNHDLFEYSHRFVGWTIGVIVLARLVIVLAVAHRPTHAPSLYFSALSLLLLAWPWVLMSKRKVTIKSPSNMVCLLMWDCRPWFSCAGTAGRVSFAWTHDYHPFALLNNVVPGKATMAVASAGDWTRSCNKKGADVDADGNPVYPAAAGKEHTMLVRRFAVPGFMYLVRTYKRVVCIGTGAGIAPIASYLPDPSVEMMILWVGRDFEATYGALYDFVARHKDIVLINTRAPPGKDNPYEPAHVLGFVEGERSVTEKTGDSRYGDRRPNLPLLAMAAVEMYGAEAVFIVSGQQATYQVVYELWQYGLHAYGATWDS